MNKYVCMWNGKQIVISEETTFRAQLLATAEFQKGTRKKVKSFDVHVLLVEKNGEEVTHTPD